MTVGVTMFTSVITEGVTLLTSVITEGVTMLRCHDGGL